ncbi:MAG: SPOR domain-containing protein, partial [Dongiaceae bacterium]
ATMPAAQQTAAGGQADALSSPKATAAPAGIVTEEALAPPSGATVAPAGQAATSKPAPQPVIATVAVAAGPQPDGKVTVVPVRKTAMFIQAGAFTNAANADRLRAKLASLGRSQIVPALVGNQRFYRVRIGPIATLAEADTMLGKVVASGHPEARLIVD